MKNYFKMIVFAGLCLVGFGVNAQTCPTLSSGNTSVAANYTQMTGHITVGRFGSATETRTVVDATDLNSVMSFSTASTTWPNNTGMPAVVDLLNNKYLSMKFNTGNKLPDPTVAHVYGRYLLNESSFSVPVTMTISTSCGDFTGSTVVCANNRVLPDHGLTFVNYPVDKNVACTLHNGQTYYLNVIAATVSGTTATSTKAANPKKPGGAGTRMCSTISCPIPLNNGPGSIYP